MTFTVNVAPNNHFWIFKKAFEVLDLNYKKYLLVDKNLFRPSEVNLLLSNPNKIKKKLAWRSKITFEELVTEMVLFDYNNEKNSLSSF